MKKGVEIKLTLSNRAIYTLIILGIFSILLVGVYAVAGSVPNPGHALSELQACSQGEILSFSSSGWDCATESDPTVQSWAKTTNPSIGGALSATTLTSSGTTQGATLKVTSTISSGTSCSSSQWGEIKRCSTSTDSYLCGCQKVSNLWKWYPLT